MDAGVPTGSFAALVDVVEGVAASGGSAADRMGSAVASLMPAVGATAGMLIVGGPDGMDVRALSGPSATPAARLKIPPEVRITAGADPLIDPIRAGSAEVTTAARAFGPDAWARSGKRRGTLEIWGIDQVVALPVRSGPAFEVVMLGRTGDDFDDDVLRLLTTLRPVMSALARILEPAAIEARALVVRLTHREGMILSLLARGHTAARMARIADCSPRTVQHHLANIYAKLGVGDRLSAVNRARELGLLELIDDSAPDELFATELASELA